MRKTAGFALRCVAVMAASCLACASAILSAPARQAQIRQPLIRGAEIEGNVISPKVARALESRVSELDAVRIVPEAVVDGAATPSATTTPAPAEPPATSPVGPAVTRPALRVVAIDAITERQVAQALVSQAAIQRLVGSQGALVPVPGVLRQTESDGEEVQLKAYAIAGRRLVYRARDRMYGGSILLGVSELLPGRPPRPLVTPIEFEVLDADVAEPARVRIERTGGFHPVALLLSAAEGGGLVRIASNLTPEPITVALPLNPALLIEPTSPGIDGFGLGATHITITALGLDRPERHWVALSSDGFLSEARARLDAQGSASVTLRSDGLGQARVTAFTPGLAPAETEVRFRPPWLTLAASLLGGLVGGILRLGLNRSPRTLAKGLALAILCGIVFFVFYVIGINLMVVTPSVTVGAALAFAISVAGGFLGTRAFRRLGAA